jgi:hypothetical protein
MLKSSGRKCLIEVVIWVFLLVLIASCAQDPVRFTQSGVEIWKLDIAMTEPFQFEMKNQKMIITPSETEKGVFSVLVEISADIDPPAGIAGLFYTEGSWKGEIRNGIFAAETSRRGDCQFEPKSVVVSGEAKGTVSGSRASGTIKEYIGAGMDLYGKWTAEKIS